MGGWVGGRMHGWMGGQDRGMRNKLCLIRWLAGQTGFW